MEAPQTASPNPPPFTSSSSSRSRSSTKLDDVTSLTSFNPFAEEDENDQSSYALVASLFSRVKNSLAAPLSSTVSSNLPQHSAPQAPNTAYASEPRRPSLQTSVSGSSNKSNGERPTSLRLNSVNPAPPLVSLTPVSGKELTYTDFERTPSKNGLFYSPDNPDGSYGTAIPGFPIQDDARSIRTTASVSIHRSASASKAIRRLHGEGLSREYWMDDALCNECYMCKSVFTAWRRKHHCRICGQVFCSRCASMIIPGTRYGQDGRIRVCNLCKSKMLDPDDEDGEDDRRSIISSVTSPFAAHQFGSEPRPLTRTHLPQSPFAASQLFGRSDSYSLFSIAEMRRPYSGSDESGFVSRPLTPADNGPDSQYGFPVPFRRAISDDDPVSLADRFRHDHSPANGSKTPVEFPLTVPVETEGQSTIAFPLSSSEQAFDSETPGMPRSRYNSYADFDGAGGSRSRVQSRLDNFGEPGWRVRRESTAYAQELNTISMFHLRIMLRQLLTSQNIPNVKEWEEILLKLALRIARELTFTAHPNRQGADMDVRRYVKIKKIPGGSPSDSEYVDGAVITKNIAHKKMDRAVGNPRVMLVTFPLEFHRIEGQYMHFQQLLLQEKEYLGNLASRIAALRPTIVLVEKPVSRIALEALTARKIVVARSVKRSAIQCVARMTQGDILNSIDKLAMEPHLGRCARVRVQTFDHPLIPGRRKTYMRFEGCNREMGCTIVLRGGDLDVLKRIKKVTRFLAFTVRNLRLETHLWKDLVISLPSLSKSATPALVDSSDLSEHEKTNKDIPSSATSITQLADSPSAEAKDIFAEKSQSYTAIDDLPDEDAEQLRLSHRIRESIEPYEKTFISVSATLRFPPPYPIRRMKELDDELKRAKQEYEDDLVRRGEKAESQSEEEMQTPAPLIQAETNEDVAAQIESLPMVEPPATPTPGGTSTNQDPPSYFDVPQPICSQVLDGTVVASPYPRSPRPPPEVPIEVTQDKDIRLQSRLDYIKWLHTEQRRIWEWYLRKNGDDFDVEKYQCISLWEFTLPIEEFGLHRACFPPRLRYITFYGENDCTLGQFIEKSVMDTLRQFLDPRAICDGKGCGQPIARHCKVFVHNETRLFVAVEQWDGQITDNAHLMTSPDTIVTWSACRICGNATPFIPISEEMQRYSFAKFLELHFYPADVQLVPGAGCEHNIYKHHIRFFAVKGMTVRFQADPIVMHEIVYPPMKIRVKPESQLHIKNDDFFQLHKRNQTWYAALIDDLKLISIDAATGDEEADKRLTFLINSLIQRAQREMVELGVTINRIYQSTSHTETLALNQVRAQRQDMIVAWQQDFDKLPKPKQLDKNSRKPSAFGSVRSMWPRKYDSVYDQHVSSTSITEVDDHGIVMRRVTGDSFTSTSSASDAEASESEQYLAHVLDIALGVDPNIILNRPPPPRPKVPEDTSSKSDPESDSTIGAPRGTITDITKDTPEEEEAQTSTAVPSGQLTDVQEGDLEQTVKPASRLRRPAQYPSVAEMVKKYQDFIPARGVEELTKTALAPGVPVSESEQESTQAVSGKPRNRQKNPRQTLSKRSSVSDFEQSYAANIAPRYIVHPPTRRWGAYGAGSRIPCPVGASSVESHPPSRRSSPDKRPSFGRTESTPRTGRHSPPSGKIQPTGPFVPKVHRLQQPQRAVGRERTKNIRQSYPGNASVPGNKATVKRSSGGTANKVSNITKHFERINKDNERASRRYSVIRGRRARPVATARAKVEILESIKDAINDEEDSEGSDSSEADDEGGDEEEVSQPPKQASPERPSASSEHVPNGETKVDVKDTVSHPAVQEESATPPETKDISRLQPPTPAEAVIPSSAPPSVPASPAMTPIEGISSSISPPPEIDIGPSGNERSSSLLKALSGFWPNQPPRHEQDDIMADPEHIFRDSSMVVRTDEPTSIIALALNSPQYRDLLAKSRAEKRLAREAKITEGGEAFMPDDRSVAESTSTWGVVNVDSNDGADPTEELRVPSSKLPWAISFESGGLTISCTVLYPEQFDALRRTYDCERSMVESLARCIKWDASGGKSGSAFLKTLDDRFIAKELSKAELQAMETFAPSYFDYMSSAVSANRPTLLAKIFGCFKITFRKTHKDKSSKTKLTQMNLLVMENLFYDRTFSKIYDLKGSTRNRHVQSTGRLNEVLLDENLVQTAHLAPFYLREHSKRILRGALYNDSRFLEELNVMDYSLVVGVDSEKNELVVGIVDYIRTYTWDKKLESWVKDSAFLGGANKGEPTIIGPKQYRQRFLSAMERYFPIVPDRWMKQHDAPEEEGNILLDLWPDW